MAGLFRNTLYVRLRPDLMSVLHVESGQEYGDLPALAIERRGDNRRIVGVGRDAVLKAALPDVVLANGFEHPRTLIADFNVAEQTLKQFLKKVLPKSLFVVSPVVVMHPQAFLEGGLTQIELRALVELCVGAGARKVFIWEGPELSAEELRELRFRRAGGRLLHPESVR
jgi:rod shape-determining protein MreB